VRIASYDLVLMDMQMPEMDGLRQRRYNVSIPRSVATPSPAAPRADVGQARNLHATALTCSTVVEGEAKPHPDERSSRVFNDWSPR
jgi:CheY-like chemotaxis protein